MEKVLLERFFKEFFIISVGPYTGETCGTFIDYCAVNRCENGGKCIPTEDSFVCECIEGFFGSRCESKGRMFKALINLLKVI